MKHSFFTLIFTGAFAIAAMVSAWLQGGRQEDIASALGGIVGFVIAITVVNVFLKPRDVGRPDCDISPEIGFAYGIFAMSYFSFIGWLTGYLHGHGDFAGAVCGGLGGLIVAVIVPALLHSPFMALGRKYQFAISLVALSVLLRIVWVMYLPEFID